MPSNAYTLGWVNNLQSHAHTSSAGQIIGLAVAFSVLAAVSVAVRLAVRWRTFHKIGLDDVAALVSALLGATYSATSIYQTKWGLGLHAEDFPIENAVEFSKIQYIGGPIYCIAILGFKLSLLGSYLRVASFDKIYYRVIYVVMVLVTMNQVIYAFLLTFSCTPIAKQWDSTIPGHCFDALATYFGLGGSSLGFDIIIIILPFPVLRKLGLDKKKKAIVACLYGFGFFVTIIQVIRILTIAQLVNYYTDSEDIIKFSIIEINLGVFIACVPCFAPLLTSFSRRVSIPWPHWNSNQSRRQPGHQNPLAPTNKTGGLTKTFLSTISKSLGLKSGVASDDEEFELQSTATLRDRVRNRLSITPQYDNSQHQYDEAFSNAIYSHSRDGRGNTSHISSNPRSPPPTHRGQTLRSFRSRGTARDLESYAGEEEVEEDVITVLREFTVSHVDAEEGYGPTTSFP